MTNKKIILILAVLFQLQGCAAPLIGAAIGALAGGIVGDSEDPNQNDKK